MNDLRIFENEEFGQVRTITKDGEPWFAGKDIAEILKYTNPLKAIRDHVDEDDKGVNESFTPGGKQDIIIINESGLYSLILGSKLPKAKEFKHWITSEVIPSIRTHGAYMTPETIEKTLTNPDFIIRLATELKKEQQARSAAEQQIEQDKPKVVFAESVTASQTTILVGELAKLLRQNGVDIGQNRLFKWLREHGYLISRKGTDYNKPTQYSMEHGLFELKETTIGHGNGDISISITPKLTGKGQLYFINKFKNEQAEKVL